MDTNLTYCNERVNGECVKLPCIPENYYLKVGGQNIKYYLA